MKSSNNLYRQLRAIASDESFVYLLKKTESVVAKILSLAMILVLIVASIDLWRVLVQELLFEEPYGFFSTTLIEIFGLFLNILIALEVLENVSAYLKKHVVQLELVIVTSLIAVARKIIIFDSKEANGLDLVGLGVVVFALAGSYWLVRRANRQDQDQDQDQESDKPDDSE